MELESTILLQILPSGVHLPASDCALRTVSSSAVYHASLSSVWLRFAGQQYSSLLIPAEAFVIALVILIIAALRLRHAQSLRKVDGSKAVFSRCDSILVLLAAVVSGCAMLFAETFKMVLHPGISLWYSEVFTILLTVLLAVLAAFAILKRDRQLRSLISANEERYKLLFERSLTGAYRASLSGRILDCNVSFCQMFGYETREEVIGQSTSLGYPSPEERIRFIEMLRAEKKLTNFEQRLQRRDGSALWALNNATLVVGKAGLEPEVKGTLTDITEIRSREQELRRLAAIVSCSDDAIISLTLDGIIETWNSGAERTLGFSAREAIGQSIAFIAPPERPNEFRQILERVGRGEVVRGLETIRIGKDGRPINLSLFVSPITNTAGNVVGAASIILDITDGKLAEEKLRKSEEQYRFLFDSNPIPMWVFDRATLRFLAVNRSAIHHYGYTENEFLGMTIAEIRPEEDIDALVEDVAKREEGLQDPGSWRHRRKNGEVISVEIHCHNLDFHGIDAMLVAAQDVTARKQSEEALLFKTALLEAQSETTIDGILIVDDSDRIVLVNKRFAAHFEIPPDLLAAGNDRPVFNYVTRQIENPEAFVEKVKFLNEQRDQKSSDEIRLLNGKTFDRYSAPLIDSNGAHRGRIWYFRDITVRKLAESAAQQATEKYRAIFEDSVLGIFQITPEGRPIRINRSLAQLHG